ncbi:MAG: O-antigen ligase family protein [Caldilineaceae bacterium]|nr:O-antigen ligase family protein [Caldilineaceae bacterium]
MRHTKVQRYCESVIEAGWLAALIIAPLFFNAYSSRVFEPDKISLIRSISLVMLLAYLVKVLDGGPLWLPAGARPPQARNIVPTAHDGAQPLFEWKLGSLWKQPLLLPVLLLALAYALSTLLSISPAVSWWGSYHRLQGAYTFSSYLIIALLTAAHLRQPSQLRRLQHTVIITSLPVSVYGVFQHFGKDPLPWGQDVTTRITSSAGNPIFLAAHLIMAFFLTLERTFSCFAYLLSSGPQPDDVASPQEDRQTPAGEPGLAGVLAGGSYLFVLVVQLLAIFWSQSRGPWLGLASGMYVFVLLLLTAMRPRNYRAWTASWVGLGVAGLLLLVLLNTTALGNAFSQVPIWGRLTTMLDSATGTGRVRVLIWEGTVKMISPHQPLTYPDGNDDPFNLLRPLIGYGPETLWMAFNRFYPPELAQWESRNASPDRAHNETWDSLAMTGVVGLLAASLLFLSIFYWALRWLGLIRSRRDGIIFLSMLIGGGLLLSLLFLLRGVSIGFLGVNWPTGLILGLIAYVTLAVFIQPESSAQPAQRPRQLLLVASLSAIIAHYVEIHLGIAIASTRIYFWTIVALMLALGMRWLNPEAFAPGEDAVGQPASNDAPDVNPGNRRSSTRARQRRGRRQARGSPMSWDLRLPTTILPDTLVVLTLAFLFTVNFRGLSNPFSILFAGLGSPAPSPSAGSLTDILWLVFFTWLIATVLGAAAAMFQLPGLAPASRANQSASTTRRRNGADDRGNTVGTGRVMARTAALYGLLLCAAWLTYGLIHAARLLPSARTGTVAEQLNHIAGHYSLYTWIAVLWCLLTGLVFAWRDLAEPRRAWLGRGLTTVGATLLFTVTVVYIIGGINIAQVRADIFYKQGQSFDASGAWVESSDLYRRALSVRPTEDYYMLFLGRSLLEQAAHAPSTASSTLPAEPSLQDILNLDVDDIARLSQVGVLAAARTVLHRAQEVNPLNTDHTANLARLHRRWSNLSQDPQDRIPQLELSLQYYDAALSLSPNVAHLWNERGQVLALMDRLDEAEASFQHSLTLDDRFENTYAFLAELYSRQNASEKLSRTLDQGMDRLPNSLTLLTLKASEQSKAGDLAGAYETILKTHDNHPTDLNAVRNLILLARSLNRPEEASRWAERAVALIENGYGHKDLVVAVYRLVAEVNEENGLLPAAVDILRRLMDLAPDDYRHPFQMARLHTELGDNRQARQFAESALSLAPDSEKAGIQSFVDTLE